MPKQLGFDFLPYRNDPQQDQIHIKNHRKNMIFHHNEMNKWYKLARDPTLPSKTRKRADYMATAHGKARTLHENALNLYMSFTNPEERKRASRKANQRTIELMELL